MFKQKKTVTLWEVEINANFATFFSDGTKKILTEIICKLGANAIINLEISAIKPLATVS